MKEALCVAIGGVIGAVVSAAINAVANYKIKAAEQKMRCDELAIQAGIKEYEFLSEAAKRKGYCIATPRYWIYHMIISLDRFLTIDTTDPIAVEESLQKVKVTTKILSKHLLDDSKGEDGL